MADALSSGAPLTVLTSTVVERSRLHFANCLVIATFVDLRNVLTAEARPGVIQARQLKEVSTDSPTEPDPIRTRSQDESVHNATHSH